MKNAKPLVYTAYSKHNFFAARMISAFVLNENKVPLNPFMNWDYFLEDMVSREQIRQANNTFVKIVDELWQFGEISDGCYAEIGLALKNKKKIRFFKIGKTLEEIQEISPADIVFEKELASKVNLEGFIEKLH